MALFWLWLLTLPTVNSKRCFEGKIIHKNNRIKRNAIFTVTAYLVLNISIRDEDIYLLASYLDM